MLDNPLPQSHLLLLLGVTLHILSKTCPEACVRAYLLEMPLLKVQQAAIVCCTAPPAKHMSQSHHLLGDGPLPGKPPDHLKFGL